MGTSGEPGVDPSLPERSKNNDEKNKITDKIE